MAKDDSKIPTFEEQVNSAKAMSSVLNILSDLISLKQNTEALYKIDPDSALKLVHGVVEELEAMIRRMEAGE